MQPEMLKKLSLDAGLPLSDDQMLQFQQYYELLVQANQKMNLTAITDRQEVYLKHFFDSITLAVYVDKLTQGAPHLIDIGSGAGFPGLPLKILLPNLQVTMMDALNKRVNFLNSVIEQLQLANIQALHGRAEDVAQDNQYREQFDFATARAVANTSTLAEYTLPFVKIGGQLLIMKAQTANQELQKATKALKVLGGNVQQQFAFNLPNGDERVIQVINKITRTPKKYPRQAGKPSKTPL